MSLFRRAATTLGTFAELWRAVWMIGGQNLQYFFTMWWKNTFRNIQFRFPSTRFVKYTLALAHTEHQVTCITSMVGWVLFNFVGLRISLFFYVVSSAYLSSRWFQVRAHVCIYTVFCYIDASLILSSALAVMFSAMLKVIYISARIVSLIFQDYFCVQRPISPPVRRIVVGLHHLEYGFPSTHSANSMAMSVVVYHFMSQLRTTISYLCVSGIMDPSVTWVWLLIKTYALESTLAAYLVTIVYGRLYLGMHTVLGTFLFMIY